MCKYCLMIIIEVKNSLYTYQIRGYNDSRSCLEVIGLKDGLEVQNLQDQSLTMLQHHINSGQ